MITCPKCGHPNDEKSKFCENCGTSLTRACPNCGKPVSLNAKFCPSCGFALQEQEDPQLARLKKLVPKEFADRLLKSRGQVERERRIVTILFSDVKGSTSMGEERDPEQVMEIMNGAFEALIEPIYRYEGTLARLMGDAILAFFGAPISHEDDPVRAVLAALAIQRKMGDYARQLERTHGVKDFSVRVGINTGLVVVGEVGSDLRVEYTAMGDAINVASRLEGAASPGNIVISENTARLVRHAFELESLGGLQLKGKSEPVPAYRVLGRKAAPVSARGIEGLYSPLVGRERELQTLQARLEDLRQSRGQIVSLIGDAGLGKSRLLAELRNSAEGKSESGVPVAELEWLEGRALSYEMSTPYSPFGDLFSRWFGLQPEEKDPDRYQKVKSKLAGLMPGRETELAPFFATMLGIELIGDDLDRVKYLMPPDVRERSYRAVVQVIEQIAAARPAVLVFEDLHWADPTSLELVIRLMDSTERAPLLLIALFRPQRQDPAWRFHETAARDFAHRYTSIELQPLDEANSRQLVANLLEIEDLPENVRQLILKKAEGNPFFVEEVIRSLLDSRLVAREDGHWRAKREIAGIQVPDTLSAVITARLDRLDEEAKHVAQTASVIGREFQLDILQDVYAARQGLDEPLRDLQRRELIREKSRLPLVLYLFKHTLTQEAAYASVLLSKRRELHRRIAECLERIDPERVNDIARHFLEAGEEERALPYLIGAGDRAARGYSMPEAIGYYLRAVQIAKAGDRLSLTRRAYEGLGNAQSFAFDIPGTVKTYEEMLQLAQAKGDVPMQVSAMNKLAMTVAMRMGQFPEAEKTLVEAERIAREHEDKPGLSETYFVRCGMCTAVGDFDGVVSAMEEAAKYGRELGVQDQIVAALDHTARSHLFMTRYDEAWKTVQEALPVARSIHNRDIEAALLITASSIYMRNGDLEAAQQAAVDGAEIGLRIGAPVSGVIGTWVLGQLAWLQGDYEAAVEHLQRSVQAAFPLEQIYPFALAMAFASLGAVYLQISPAFSPRAAEMQTHALELMNTPAGMAAGGTAWAEIGFSRLAAGDVEGAAALFQKGLTMPTMMGYINKPQLLLGSALVAAMQKRPEDAARLVGEAREFVQERGMKHLYAHVALTEGQVRFACGENDQALEPFARAESLAGELGIRPVVWQARAAEAQVLSARGRREEADAKWREAQAMLDEIASLFKDEELRAAFVESSRRTIAKGG